MKKSAKFSEAVWIGIHFPLPVPDDFGKSLRVKLEEVLDPRDTIATSRKRNKEGTETGWVFEVELKKPATLMEAIEKLILVLRQQNVAAATVIEPRWRRGPVRIALEDADACTSKLDSLAFEGPSDTWFSKVFFRISGPKEGHEELKAAIAKSIEGTGIIELATYWAPNSSFVLRIDSFPHLQPCVSALVKWMNSLPNLAVEGFEAFSYSTSFKRLVYED